MSDDSGSTLIELIGLSVMLLIPLAYLGISVFEVQRAVFAAGAAAHEAGRALVLADSTDQGIERADAAMRLSLEDQHAGDGVLTFHPGGAGCDSGQITPVLTPGERYDVCVRLRASSITVTGRMTAQVDEYREQR